MWGNCSALVDKGKDTCDGGGVWVTTSSGEDSVDVGLRLVDMVAGELEFWCVED